ncbi:MAG: hypothetical protein QM722_19565 [Piscinibacter sp.]
MNEPHPQDDASLARWLGGLRGESAADAPDAQALRTLLQSESAREQAAAKAGGEDFHADRLVERLRREGLLDAAPAPKAAAARPSWLRSLRWALPSVAVALAALWMVVPPATDPYGEAPGYRGGLQEIGTAVADPRRSAEAAAAALRAAGIEASIYSARPVYLVDLDVTDDNRAAVQAALKPIAPPAAAASLPSGTLRLRFQKP